MSVCVCVCVDVYVRICMCFFVYMCLRSHAYVCVRVCVLIRTCLPACLCAREPQRGLFAVSAGECVCVRVSVMLEFTAVVFHSEVF